MKKIYKNCHLAGQDTMVDILVENGKFAAIQEHIEAGEVEAIDVGGKLVVPPYVDPHLFILPKEPEPEMIQAPCLRGFSAGAKPRLVLLLRS